MDEKKIQRIGKLGTFVLGGIAGAAAGILLAPRSGRETRGAMSSRAGEARESGREGYFEARERARERLAGMREPRPADGDTAEIPLGPPEEPHVEDTVEENAPGERPGLRAVPPEEAPEESEERPGEDGDPEALKRRIRQTRERLGRRGEDGDDGR